MGRLAIFGVGAIAVFIAGCVLVIALATRDGGSGARGAPAAPARAQTAGGAVVIRQGTWTAGQPWSPGEYPPLPALAPEPLPVQAPGVRPRPDGEVKAVDWKREKPPRSAEDLN